MLENKCKIKQSLIQFEVLSLLSGTLYDLIVGQSSIREYNLIGFYLDRFVDENTARSQEGSVQPAERIHTQSNSGNPNSRLVNSLIDLRGREIDNPQYVAPDNADDIDFPNESQPWDTREAKITQHVDDQIPSQICLVFAERYSI